MVRERVTELPGDLAVCPIIIRDGIERHNPLVSWI
jgi:hypothetical protein